MQIKYLGHASFLITAENGTRVQFDPYEPGGYEGGLRYGEFTDPADVVVVSHSHADHNYVEGVPGDPEVVEGTGRKATRGIEFRRYDVYHDAAQGEERGENIMTVCEMDGVEICHVGDLGHELTAEQAASIGEVDVLLLCVGGTFTIDATQATRVMETLSPRLCIPMHYKTDKVDFPLAPVDEFLKGKQGVKRMDRSKVEIDADGLPEEREIWVLEPAL